MEDREKRSIREYYEKNKEWLQKIAQSSTLTTCVYPKWKCPCDSVSSLGGVLNEKNQFSQD